MAQNIRQAKPDDVPSIAQLLAACNLPDAKFSDHLHYFLVTEIGEELSSVVGLECYGQVALLRSVAVHPEYRSLGLAQELVRQVLDNAYAQGVQNVFLLTTTADEYFLRFGFQPAKRTEVPEAMLSSLEFQGACPASAQLMSLNLYSPPILLRRASSNDVPAITRIYNQGIEEGATFETQLRTEEERGQWLEQHQGRYFAIVAVRLGEVVGWACLNPFSPRTAYQWVADLSVYVERSARNSGVGTALMKELERRAREQKFHKLVLTTFPDIPAATFYEKLNYYRVGIYKEQGQLRGCWQDTLIMEKLLVDSHPNQKI